MKAETNFTKAIHICLFLNLKEGTLKSSVQLAQSVATNPVVIRRLVSLLRNYGLIQSVSGPKGGFKLAHSPKDITLWMIYCAVKRNELFTHSKVNPECDISCHLDTLVKDVFSFAELAMKPKLSSVSIHSLSEDWRELMDELSEQHELK